jgi:adenylyl-sulfate kinase
MGRVVWLTGLSGSGKTTLVRALEESLRGRQVPAVVLDGDRLRKGLCSDLGFSPGDRSENVRRVAEVACLFADAGLVVLVSLIAPFRAGRERARTIVGRERFLEVYLDVPLEVCEARDPKGLYAKARRGEISGFTGVDAPYEIPQAPDLSLPTHQLSLEESLARLLDQLESMATR